MLLSHDTANRATLYLPELLLLLLLFNIGFPLKRTTTRLCTVRVRNIKTTLEIEKSLNRVSVAPTGLSRGHTAPRWNSRAMMREDERRSANGGAKGMVCGDTMYMLIVRCCFQSICPSLHAREPPLLSAEAV